MRKCLLVGVAIIGIAVVLAGRAVAEPIEDGLIAVERGDFATAFQLWRPPAEEGHPVAQMGLGGMYQKGRGVAQDDDMAAKWYRRAAEQGVAGAQFNLGMMYAMETGVPQDLVQAHFWLNLAAAQGKKTALEGRDLVAKQMTADQLAEAQRLAREWNPKAER